MLHVSTTARMWLDAIVDHQCCGKVLVAADDPIRGMLGFACRGCGGWFLIGVSSLKRTKGSLTQEEWEMIDTAEGRRMMAWYFMGSIVQVLDEVEL